jgi:hypothetical protein
MIPLFVLPFTLLRRNREWFWRALPAAINTFMKSLHCTDHHPIRIGDERERLVTASPVMAKSRAPAGGNNYSENGLVKPPSWGKGAAPLSGAEERTARAISAHAQRTCLLSLQMGSIN